MLRRLVLKNFRAFRSQSFDFSQINVFVGPNNVGKSSILSAINLVAQTVTSPDPSSPLLLTGPYDDLGTFIDVVHGNRSNTPLGLEFTLENYSYSVEYKYRKQRREIEISKFELFRKDQRLYSYSTRKDAYDIFYHGRRFETLFPGAAKRRPDFLGFFPIDKNIRDYTLPIRHRRKQLNEIPRSLRDRLVRLDRELFRARRTLSAGFEMYDSLGSFRAPPQRTYVYTGLTPQSIGSTGSNAVNILVSDSVKRGSARLGIVEKVSRWFKETGMAKGVKVKSLTPRHFEICLISVDDSEHNICDVGFGCSQVLPVLIGGLRLAGGGEKALSYKRPIFVVQEPEIHLHPNAQAELGTFFKNLTQLGVQIFIETHSDNLVLRLQKHVADGNIENDQIRFFYVNDIRGTKEVVESTVDKEGIFLRPWPFGFFPQRQQESLALAQAPLQKKKSHKKKNGE